MPHRALLVCAASMALALSPAVAAGARPDQPSDAPAAVAQGHGDRDGDGIDDVLAAPLRRAADRDRFAVIVTGTDLAAAQRSVGRVALRYERPLIDGLVM